MALSKKAKQGVIKKSQKHDSDTGSSNVQVGILNARIKRLTSHLSKKGKGKNDKHSRRGLLGLVAKRRKHESQVAKKTKVSKK